VGIRKLIADDAPFPNSSKDHRSLSRNSKKRPLEIDSDDDTDLDLSKVDPETAIQTLREKLKKSKVPSRQLNPP